MAEFEKVATVEDIEPGGRKPVIVDEFPVLLIRIGDNFYAIEDVCTHDGNPLTEGAIEGNEIICPRHGAHFDITTGDALTMPATEPVETFEVEVRDGDIYVKLKD